MQIDEINVGMSSFPFSQSEADITCSAVLQSTEACHVFPPCKSS